MRTGYEKTFAIDQERMERVEQKRREGKGLVGGDIHRIPNAHRGLREHLDFTDVPEIRRFTEGDEEARNKATFLDHRPLEIEVGFGGGAFLIDRASRHPDRHFVGFEIRRYLCLAAVKEIHQKQLDNLRICFEDVRQSLPDLLPDQSIRRCSVFFPDPWWKRKHMKRRILTPTFLDLMFAKLEEDGILHVKTDVAPYGDIIQQYFDADPRFQPMAPSEDHLFADDAPTEREVFCQKEGHPFQDFRYRRKG